MPVSRLLPTVSPTVRDRPSCGPPAAVSACLSPARSSTRAAKTPRQNPTADRDTAPALAEPTLSHARQTPRPRGWSPSSPCRPGRRWEADSIDSAVRLQQTHAAAALGPGNRWIGRLQKNSRTRERKIGVRIGRSKVSFQLTRCARECLDLFRAGSELLLQ